jgi:hypothetical protein
MARKQQDDNGWDDWLENRVRDLLFSTLFLAGIAFVLVLAALALCAIPFFLGYLVAARLLYWLFERFWMWVAPGSAGRVHTWPDDTNTVIYMAIGFALYFISIGFAPDLLTSWLAFLYAKAHSVPELLGMAAENCGRAPSVGDGCVDCAKAALQFHPVFLKRVVITLLVAATVYDWMGKTDVAGRLMTIERQT